MVANTASDTTLQKSAITASGHQCVGPRDKGTTHSRELPEGAVGTRRRRGGTSGRPGSNRHHQLGRLARVA